MAGRRRSLYLHQIPQTNFETRIAAREASAKLFSQFLVHVAATAPAGVGPPLWFHEDSTS